MIPYQEITAAADRRWTSRLLTRLATSDPADEELDALVTALCSLSDPRSFAPLEAVLLDDGRPARVREAAGFVLRSMDHVALEPEPGKVFHWWREGDDLLRKHALCCMDWVCCPEELLRVAADGTHALQAVALGRMAWGFDLPGREAVKIAALSHERAEVRSAAATVLLWDEPAAAEEPLLLATADPVPEVAVEAAHALAYYASLRTIRGLHGLFRHPNSEVRDQARISFQYVRDEVLICLRYRREQVVHHLRSWLRPVMDLLAFRPEEFRPGDDIPAIPPSAEEACPIVPVADVLQMLADPDVSPFVLDEQLRSIAWDGYSFEVRRRLRPALLGHADQLVRQCAASIFEDWEDVDGLLELLRDPDFPVRKSAMYHLGQLPATPGVADEAWEHLFRGSARGTHASETLCTYVRHANPEVAIPRLHDLAADLRQREGLRVTAVEELVRLQAVQHVARLSWLLAEPPAVTWALHIAVLHGIRMLGLPCPALRLLREVDNLFVQEAVAGLQQ